MLLGVSTSLSVTAIYPTKPSSAFTHISGIAIILFHRKNELLLVLMRCNLNIRRSFVWTFRPRGQFSYVRHGVRKKNMNISDE